MDVTPQSPEGEENAGCNDWKLYTEGNGFLNLIKEST
jgi:hypothetical protein